MCIIFTIMLLYGIGPSRKYATLVNLCIFRAISCSSPSIFKEPLSLFSRKCINIFMQSFYHPKMFNFMNNLSHGLCNHYKFYGISNRMRKVSSHGVKHTVKSNNIRFLVIFFYVYIVLFQFSMTRSVCAIGQYQDVRRR